MKTRQLEVILMVNEQSKAVWCGFNGARIQTETRDEIMGEIQHAKDKLIFDGSYKDLTIVTIPLTEDSVRFFPEDLEKILSASALFSGDDGALDNVLPSLFMFAYNLGKKEKQVMVRPHDRGSVHASLTGVQGVWGSGKNLHEAIGSMVCAHPESFGIKIVETP